MLGSLSRTSLAPVTRRILCNRALLAGLLISACLPHPHEKERSHPPRADKECAACHPDQARRIRNSPMWKAQGIQRTTLHSLSHVPQDRVIGYTGQLCSNCHLEPSNEKTSRGHGCLSCHEGEKNQIIKKPPDNQCFGCHSGSGRISLSYEGLQEVFERPAPAGAREFEPGRYAITHEPDVHRKAGLMCVDCHGEAELKPETSLSNHERGERVPVRCEHCHTKQQKNHGEARHARLSCDSCHSGPSPSCIGCHVEFEGGRWTEYRGESRFTLPVLGMHRGRIRPFIPGMKVQFQNYAPVDYFVPLSPHRTGKSRSCSSCHRSPEALGFGSGTLVRESGGWSFSSRYETSPGPEGHSLAEDGWVAPFVRYLNYRNLSVIKDVRPFLPDEQKRILEAPIP